VGSHWRFGASFTIVAVLTGGFVYSAAASVREYRKLFQRAPAIGPSASVDALLRPLQIESAEAFRAAVKQPGWSHQDEVVIVVRHPDMSAQEMRQLNFAAAYLLFPKRIRLALP
jgi:hypothetical protein